ncbi:MAG: molecular chaperone Hsp90 [Oscillospiraceae bacterium]|jgi:hypothetical protein
MTKEEMKKNVDELLSNKGGCPEFRDACKKWSDSFGTDGEKDAWKALVKEAGEDIEGIDGLIEFMGSDRAAKLFGAEAAEKMKAQQEERKKNGAKYCNCPACTLALQIMENSGLC